MLPQQREHKLSACNNTNSRGLSHSLINTHFAFLIGNSGIVLEKRIPSRFDDGSILAERS